MKQFFVVDDYQISPFKKLRKGDIIFLPEEEAITLLACHAILPLYTAIKAGLYKPAEPKTNLLEKIIDAVTPDPEPKKESKPQATPKAPQVAPAPTTSVDTPPQGKEFFNNSLQQIIQAKKARSKK